MAQEIISDGGFATKPQEKFAMIGCSCCNRMVPGKIVYWPGMQAEKILLWKPCKECGVWLSHLEEDDSGLKGRCFDCHKERNL